MPRACGSCQIVRTRRVGSLAAVVVACVTAAGLLRAQDTSRTTVAAARAAADSNSRTAAGKSFQRKFEVTFIREHFSDLARCKAAAASDPRGFRLLFKLDADGAASEVLLDPSTRFGECVRASIAGATYLTPPHAGYWVDTVWQPREGAGRRGRS